MALEPHVDAQLPPFLLWVWGTNFILRPKRSQHVSSLIHSLNKHFLTFTMYQAWQQVFRRLITLPLGLPGLVGDNV